MNSEPFRVGLTADFLDDEGNLPPWDVGLDVLREITSDYEFMPDLPEIEPDHISAPDGVRRPIVTRP